MLNKAIINLNNLIYNAKQIKHTLHNSVKFCAVVKADAYGHGASVCANALYPYVDCFAVALVEEGVALRYAGIDKDILVLVCCCKNEISRALEYRLTITVQSLAQVKSVCSFAKRLKVKAKVHIKYNTGMNRQGVDDLLELEQILKYLSANEKYIELDGFYSHLSCPENKKITNVALNKFLLAKTLVKSYNKNTTCHISASGGLLCGVQEDMVRVGIMLYGYLPYKTNKIKLKHVMSVYAPVIKRVKLKPFSRCLYGLFRVKKPTDIKLVRFGYADGLERKMVKGQINNRCMDLTAIKDNLSSKNGVLIMKDAEVLAKKYKTIAYEVLTKITIRAEKIYVK